MTTLYAGPGKVYFNGQGLFPEGEVGECAAVMNEVTSQIAAGMFGRVSEQVVDQTAEVSVKPFDSWSLIPLMFPQFLGATSSAGAGALVIGTRPHTNAHVPCVLWAPDGRKITLVRTAVTGHPTLHLGITKPLFDAVRISAIGDETLLPGAVGYLFQGNNIVEAGAADPGGNFALADPIRSSWTGVWGTVAGFGGGAQDVAMQAEDEWTIQTTVRYSPKMVQGRTLAMTLDSVEFMARVRPYGPTQSQILTQVGTHTQGLRLGSADLTLSSTLGGKTITLKNCEVKGFGARFGTTKLGTDEIAFVTTTQFAAGAPQPLIVFSA